MSLSKRLNRYILTNSTAMIGFALYIIADTFFISVAEGTIGMAVLNMALPIFAIIFALGQLVGIGSATRYSLTKSAAGKGDARYFSNSLIWSLLIGAFFTVVAVVASPAVVRLMGGSEEVMDIAVPYFKIIMLFGPLFTTNYTFTSFARNDNAPKIAMAATLLSSLFNILFDYILMFPLKLSMTGAALATGFSPVVSILICVFFWYIKSKNIRFNIMLPSPVMLARSCYLGIVAFTTEIASGVTTFVFNMLLLRLGGNVTVAAYGVIANIAAVATAIFNGVSQGLQPLASESVSLGRLADLKFIKKRAITIGIGCAAGLVAVSWLFTPALVYVFNTSGDMELQALAEPGMRIYFVGFIIASINIITAGIYSATGRGRDSAVVSVLRGLVFITICAIVLANLFGITGVWLAFPVSEVLTLIVSKIAIKEK